jgi:hypothetical protein
MATRGPPAIVSDPLRRGAILHYPRAEDDTPSQPTVYTVFQTSEPVLFSPLTDGIFEKVRQNPVKLLLNIIVCHLQKLRGSFAPFIMLLYCTQIETEI